MFKGPDFDDTVDIKIYRGKDLKTLNMNGHLAVNRASRHEALTIKLTFTPKNYKKHYVFVGKGLTYDSGGLSIKPGNHMTTMKADKAGAMTVWGLMKYIKENPSEIKNKVTVYMGVAENMIDGSAYKPDDILTMKNGKTVHVKNTDAEGRLVLFDNLCLAEEENKDITAIYSLATLTGAAVYQFGDEAAGMVGFNDKMKKEIKKIGNKTGEIFMDAEFHKYMLDGVNDTTADLSNTGTPNQGCQKAGLFLTNALTKKTKKKYLHLDIAGPAFVKKGFGSNPENATGFGVRTLISLVK
jgi:leucyl aminopeptidase